MLCQAGFGGEISLVFGGVEKVLIFEVELEWYGFQVNFLVCLMNMVSIELW